MTRTCQRDAGQNGDPIDPLRSSNSKTDPARPEAREVRDAIAAIIASCNLAACTSIHCTPIALQTLCSCRSVCLSTRKHPESCFVCNSRRHCRLQQ
jgi:hypothetical protein